MLLWDLYMITLVRAFLLLRVFEAHTTVESWSPEMFLVTFPD